jgi:putative DNA methylase
VNDDKRLIEDYLPIQEISAEGSREKNVRKGHIATLHLWWARRPLVACRAAVYAALVPTLQFVPNAGTDAQKKNLGRANAAKFVTNLCRYPGSPHAIGEAQQHILKAHANRLSKEQGKKVTIEDILAGRAPRPRVLDMFAGGGAIPLEALRLGCEAYALDLNPVAYIIQLCTLVYPQKYGKPDPTSRGMTGPKNQMGELTWGGLADEVRYWGNWVLRKVKAEIGDLYPLIADREFSGSRPSLQTDWLKEQTNDGMPPGYLMPVGYLWTRTVRCKNPTCGAVVPLVKQTWLCKKEGRHVALKMIPSKGEKRARFEVIKSRSISGLGFDPESYSKSGNATCPFCGTVSDSDYVKAEAVAKRLGQQMMAVACTKPGTEGKIYISPDSNCSVRHNEQLIEDRLRAFCNNTGLRPPDEPMDTRDPTTVAGRGFGITNWSELFTRRQMLSLLAFANGVKLARQQMTKDNLSPEKQKALVTILAGMVDKLADFCSTGCIWNYTGGRGVKNTFARQALPMTWDFSETNPFNPAGASWIAISDDIPSALANLAFPSEWPEVRRGSATKLPWQNETVDAVITDPPYYDNISYAVLSDFFYIWLKRSIGDLYPEHFGSLLSPKKSEAISDSVRHGSKEKGREHYERMMAESFMEASRVLKRDGELVIVYAHKTTLGWATLVDSLRRAGFAVMEAWPLDTEKAGRVIAQDAAALASSIFLVARKRHGAGTGNYEEHVRSELEELVRERVETLWDMGISGADLVIACVGAGLRAFTRFSRVEYANGEEVPAERFLTEVETVVLETILARLSKEVGGKSSRYSLAGLDPATRFYILWRYTYGATDLDAGEAIVFANGTHVELDAHGGLTSGHLALVEKKKSRYRLRDFTERGDDEQLGKPSEGGQSAPLIDILHRALWLMEKRPLELPAYLRESQPNREQLRLVAQALAGPALKGGELGNISSSAELSALAKLTSNWQSVIEDAAMAPGEKEDRRTGQQRLKL